MYNELEIKELREQLLKIMGSNPHSQRYWAVHINIATDTMRKVLKGSVDLSTMTLSRIRYFIDNYKQQLANQYSKSSVKQGCFPEFGFSPRFMCPRCRAWHHHFNWKPQPQEETFIQIIPIS